ncbi:ArpU family phage packaging/lysis transcriptional regulator [Chengkuizengella marina]|uniref:ArpU family transcriptional regulator n=1 Tax=Chengkuizengella marina TaxID=2507566 RepID=A0A6N9Q8P3_9BACL|nr:ArpU family phage packaging/lysis transcriptional regulator [Chengkuizengella marina]NBI31248.1 ArpU family transcriptional regulator [Chengkuizengella marina]
MEQVCFDLPKLDQKATRKKVLKVLRIAREYKQVGFVRKTIQTTPSYALREHGNTYAISKQVEDVGIWNVDRETVMKKAYEAVQLSLPRLYEKERQIIVRRYLEREDVCDLEIYTALHMSERKYYRMKLQAFNKLAYMLRIEVIG